MPKTSGGSIGTLTSAQPIREASATAKHTVGTRLAMGDGRVFYYGKAAGTIAASTVVSQDYSAGGAWAVGVDGACVAITAANRRLGNTDVAITAALAIGDTGVGVTHGSYLDGIVAGQLQNGYIFLNDTGTTNQYYKIKDNTAVAAVTADVVEILLYDPIVAATVDATCSVVVMQNPFMSLAGADGDVDEHPVGVAAAALAGATPYGWIQTWGECSILTNANTDFAGTGLQLSTTVGAAEQIDAAGILTHIGAGIADVATASDGVAGYIMLRP